MVAAVTFRMKQVVTAGSDRGNTVSILAPYIGAQLFTVDTLWVLGKTLGL